MEMGPLKMSLVTMKSYQSRGLPKVKGLVASEKNVEWRERGPHGGRPCGGRENTVYTRSAGSWEQGRPHLLASIRLPQPEDRHLRRSSCSACGSLLRCPWQMDGAHASLPGLGSGVSLTVGSKRLGRSSPHHCTGCLEGKSPGQRGLGRAGRMLTGKEGG